MFLSFANFYRRFIRNFSRIAAPLISILWTTGNDGLGAEASQHEENQDATGVAGGGRVGKSIKNLSTAAKLTKSKKPKLTKPKKSDLIKAQNFVKTNSFKTDFLTPEAKKVFIYLQKSFTKAPIFRHFDLKCYIQIETDALGYAIGRILSQMTLDQYSSNWVTHKDPNSDFSKFEIGQWHPVAFFFKRWSPLRLGTKPPIKSSWLLLKPLRLGATIWKAANTSFSSSLITRTSVNSWIRRVWALAKSARPKSSLNTTSESIIVRKRLILRLIPCLASLKGARLKKRLSEMKTLRFFIVCRPH